jgi:hypothetical protein
MLSDQELIDGLRSGLATLQPRSDLIDCLRERAGEGQARDLPARQAHRPRWLPTFSGVVAMVSVLVALVVGVGAMVLLSGHHRLAHAPAIGTQTTPALPTATSPPASSAHPSTSSRRNCAPPRRPRRPKSSPLASSWSPSPGYPKAAARTPCSS